MLKRDLEGPKPVRRIVRPVRQAGVVLALLMCAAALPRSAGALGPGDPAPGFMLADAFNMQHKLEAARGKVVLLAFVGYS